MGQLSEEYEAIRELDAEVLAISVDDLSGASDIADRIGIPFPVLYDPEGTVPKAYMVYGLVEEGRAAPSTFILDKDGVIRWKYVGTSISDRVSGTQVVEELRVIQG